MTDSAKPKMQTRPVSASQRDMALLKERNELQAQREKKTARLRALRLAKEAADREAAEKEAAERAAAKVKTPAKRARAAK